MVFSVAEASSCKQCHSFIIADDVIKTAKKYKHVREKTNNNDSPEIDLWLKRCGLGGGYSYCQAYVNSMYKETFESHLLKSPLPMTAGVANFAQICSKRPFEFKIISTKKLNWGVEKAEVGDIASWKHGSANFNGFGYMGHAGLVISSDAKKNIYTIEGNTKAGNGGDQSGTVKGDMRYGHEGVYERVRKINLESNFPIVYFIRLQKREF